MSNEQSVIVAFIIGLIASALIVFYISQEKIRLGNSAQTLIAECLVNFNHVILTFPCSIDGCLRSLFLCLYV